MSKTTDTDPDAGSTTWEEIVDEYEETLEWLADHDDPAVRRLGEYPLEEGR